MTDQQIPLVIAIRMHSRFQATKKPGTFFEAAAKETPELTVADRKAKEGVKTENNGYINLKMVGQESSMVQFKFNRHIPLNKLMKAYYEQQSLSVKQVRFQFDGQPVNEVDIPAQLEVEFEDIIDVFQQQTGGVYYKGNMLFIPEFHSHRPGIHSQLENYNLVVLKLVVIECIVVAT
ncbi:small ubiquitin-related modifier 2-like [Lemur catta]|uniref:small ubiquitin-related modifier 2-like n=1 Tax=Lemur catta TaxID=9447 RepID=UPI001E26879B|nr:small ubiquitin-related modifier 2-like [Lemur catta]